MFPLNDCLQIQTAIIYLPTFCSLINFFAVKVIHSQRVKLFYATANTNNTKSEEKGTSVSCNRKYADEAPLFGYALVGSPLVYLYLLH